MTWTDIKGYEGLYQFSPDGMIKDENGTIKYIAEYITPRQQFREGPSDYNIQDLPGELWMDIEGY